jgi:metal-responsive CopG/Arc/MetJ family transcriptional regulator
MSNYQSISLEKELIAKVDQIIADNPFVISRAEFCRRALQEFLKEFEKK